jgi:hypothetical protein
MPVTAFDTSKPISLAMAERWLSPARLSVYLEISGHDLPVALDLYAWNAALAGAVARDLGHIEVLLRNAYDKIISKAYGEWTDLNNPFHLLLQGFASTQERQSRANAKSLTSLRDAGSGEAGRTHGHVVANLSLGYWVSLSERFRDDTHWTPLLHKAYPAGTSRGQAHDLLVGLLTLRNRCAHLEPLFSNTSELARRLNNISRLAAMLSPQVQDWIRDRSAVAEVIDACPVARLCGDVDRSAYLNGKPRD